MKVTLDLNKLLHEGSISNEEYSRFLKLAKKHESSHAFSILVVLAIIAVVIGFVGLNATLFMEIGRSLYNLLGSQGIHLLALLACWAAGYNTKSGFLIGFGAFVILSLLGGSTLYSHAAYFVAIQEPALTVIVFALLAIASLMLSKKVEYDDERLAIIFSRTCLIIVNMGFWIGSLWGSAFGEGIKVSSKVFAFGWAAGLLAVGFWGAKEGRRFVVNTAAVFGSIHFYTQWFERLGASPGSLFGAGLIALGIMYGLRNYNLATQSKS